MEARASLKGASVSKTFIAAILVLVTMGLGAMGGYVAKGLGASGSAGAQTQVVHPAPGTVLRQDNPAGQSTSGDTQHIQGVRGGHGELP